MVMMMAGVSQAQRGPGAEFGSFRKSPRIDRYNVERKVFETLYGPSAHRWVASKLSGTGGLVSVLNMSYEYGETRNGVGVGFCSVAELVATSRLVLSMLSKISEFY